MFTTKYKPTELDVKLYELEQRFQEANRGWQELAKVVSKLADVLGYEYIPEQTKTIKAHWKKIKKGK